MNQDIVALMIFYGGLSVFVAGGLLYGLWEWRHWKKKEPHRICNPDGWKRLS